MEVTIFKITDKELEENPRLALKLLLGLWFQRLGQLHKERIEDPEIDGMTTLLFGWIFCRPALSCKEALEILEQQPEPHLLDRLLILTLSGKRGRPITKRHAAIQALFRLEYLRKSWVEITKRVCPCGEPHTNQRVLMQCRDGLQAEVRHLKRLLRICKIELS